MVKAGSLGDSSLKIIFNNPRNNILASPGHQKISMSSGISDKEENSPLYSTIKESGIFITFIRKKVPRVLVMFPVQVRDTRNKDGFKNVDCSPKVKMEAV